MTEVKTLDDAIPRLVEALHTNGFPFDGGERQILALAEEAGEFVGAYRRHVGKARRSGTFEELAEELADVLITARVTAEELSLNLEWGRVVSNGETPLSLFYAVARVVDCWREGSEIIGSRRVLRVGRRALRMALMAVVDICPRVAKELEIDLDEAVRLKLARIFTRGWHEQVNS